MSTSHLMLGRAVDCITGKVLVDTHDERARQKIARFLVEEKAYSKDEVEVRQEIDLTLDNDRGTGRVDFVIRLADKAYAVTIFGPGSLVSRERSALTAARLLKEEYVVPFVIVTNGADAEVLERAFGKVAAMGLDAIPSKAEALRTIEDLSFDRISGDGNRKKGFFLPLTSSLNGGAKSLCAVFN